VSIHEVQVVKLGKPIPHENADRLEIFQVWGYQTIVQKGLWKEGNLAAFIEPDYIVPDTEEFAFLGGREKDRRIKARRFRGVWSYGLLHPLPTRQELLCRRGLFPLEATFLRQLLFGFCEGDNVIGIMGVTRWEPPIRRSTGSRGKGARPSYDLTASPPPGIYPIYDLEHALKYHRLLEEGEEIEVTEKIHGASCRFVRVGGQIYCGSRKEWKKPHRGNLWWAVLIQTPRLLDFLRAYENLAVYGEVYGAVQDLRYGAKGDAVYFAAFDLLDVKSGNWLPLDTPLRKELPWVPVLYRGPYQIVTDANPPEGSLLPLAQGKSKVIEADHIREGCVIAPRRERYDQKIGRVKLKLINPDYLAR